jgi:hypothetical protein
MENDRAKQVSEPTFPNKPEPVILDYAPPPPHIGAGRTFAALCSIPAALFGIYTIFIGIYLIFQGATEEHKAYRGEDAASGAVVVVIGIVSSLAAIRWGREGFLGHLPSSRRKR